MKLRFNGLAGLLLVMVIMVGVADGAVRFDITDDGSHCQAIFWQDAQYDGAYYGGGLVFDFAGELENTQLMNFASIDPELSDQGRIGWNWQSGVIYHYPEMILVGAYSGGYLHSVGESSPGADSNMQLASEAECLANNWPTFVPYQGTFAISFDYSQPVTVNVSGNWNGQTDLSHLNFTVPEPATLGLLLIGSIAIAKRKRS